MEVYGLLYLCETVRELKYKQRGLRQEFPGLSVRDSVERAFISDQLSENPAQ